jgi:GT2 family glycosyltransferase
VTSNGRAGGSSAPRLAIVVVSFGSHDLLERNLATIGPGVTPRQVIVVDNRSTEAERSACTALAERHGWTLLTPGGNLGFGTAVNLAVDRALADGCDRLLLLNPDVTIDAAAIDALVRAGESRPDTVVSPRLLRPDGTTWFAGGQIDLATGFTRTRPDQPQVGPGRWLTGACLLLDRATWVSLGGFDDRYFLYWEDVDLTQRQLRRGGELAVIDDVTAVHSVGGTQRAHGKTPLYCYFNTRNRLLFAARHLPARTRLTWLLRAPAYAWRTTMLSGRRVALRRPALAWASLRGTAAGIAALVGSLARPASSRRDG